MRDATMLQMSRPSEQRVVIGIGEYGVSKHPDGVIVTHALGSCVAVCLWDPVASVAGMLHILLPDSRINLERAAQQPGAFADTGIPLLFHAAYQQGAVKTRCRVQLIGAWAKLPPPRRVSRRGLRGRRRARTNLYDQKSRRPSPRRG